MVVFVVAVAQLILPLVVTLCCWLCFCRCCVSAHTAVGCVSVLLLFLCRCSGSAHTAVCLCLFAVVVSVVALSELISLLVVTLLLLCPSSYCRWLCLCGVVVFVVAVVQLILPLVVTLCCCLCFCRCCGSAHTAVGCVSVFFFSVVALAQLVLPLVVSLCCSCFCCCSV